MQDYSSKNHSSSAENKTKTLRAQRNYTLALYADLPAPMWEPAAVPYLATINPPLWELGHVAWFQEYFALRKPCAQVVGGNEMLPPASRAFADTLFDSNTVAHVDRWRNHYPSRDAVFGYMDEVLDRVCAAIENGNTHGNIDLILAHEYMHQEALVMTLASLDFPMPGFIAKPRVHAAKTIDIAMAGGEIWLGECNTTCNAPRFQFDNESPPMRASVKPFTIASQPVTAAEMDAFRSSADYADAKLWPAESNAWRESGVLRLSAKTDAKTGAKTEKNVAVMHVNFYEAEAYCRASNRRLPTEAEWEFAATHSSDFWASVGDIWEWTASPLAPYPGFTRGVYAQYSEPWFHTHQVLKGASFATHARMKYPQYRNFYTKERNDMFCGFRTCALV